MAEAYIFYSSLTLLGMGCLTLALSIFFRLKFRAVEGSSEGLQAKVFDKTFMVFNPYPESRRLIHRFLFVLPMVAFIVSFGFSLVAWSVLESGLALSLVTLIVCLNLMLLEVAFEVYQNARVFVKAVRCGAGFGVGDVRVFRIVRKALPRLSNYYLGLAILFVGLGMGFSYIWPSMLWFIGWFIGLVLGAGAASGPLGWQIAVLIFAVVFLVVQILVWKIRDNFLRYLIELPAVED